MGKFCRVPRSPLDSSDLKTLLCLLTVFQAQIHRLSTWFSKANHAWRELPTQGKWQLEGGSLCSRRVIPITSSSFLSSFRIGIQMIISFLAFGKIQPEKILPASPACSQLGLQSHMEPETHTVSLWGSPTSRDLTHSTCLTKGDQGHLYL